MLNEPSLQKLYDLRLAAMAEAWQEQEKDPQIHQLTFNERLAFLIDAEHLARENRRIQRNMKRAHLRDPTACLEDVRTGSRRGIEKAQVGQLASCRWVTEHQNILITGPTGVGKSYLASALGQTAVRKGFRVAYRRVPRLFEELAIARAEGSYARLLADLLKHEVLVLDDLGLAIPKTAQRHDLLEVLEDRDGRAATVVTSQLPTENWYTWLEDPTLADAILDRLLSGAYKVQLKGESQRKQRTKSE